MAASGDERGRLCVDGSECRDHVCGQELAPAPAERLYTFTNTAGEVFAGVLGAEQRTIACAANGVLEVRINARRLPARSDVRVTISDEKGRAWTVQRPPREPITFRLQRGTYAVAVTAPHCSAFRTMAVVGETRRLVTPELKPLPVLSGTLIDRRTGRGIAGALVGTDVETETIADGDGRFVLEADPEHWPKSISFHAGGYAETIIDVPPARLSASLDRIYLSPGGTIVVELTQDRAGDAVEIELQRLRDNGRSVGAVVKTLPVPNDEPTAVLRLEGVEPGDYLVLVKGDQQWERLGEPVSVVAGETGTLQLRIAPFPLRLRTVREGQPFPKAYVEVRNRDVHWSGVIVTDDAGEAIVQLWQGGRMSSTLHAPGIVPFLERREVADGEEAEWVIDLPTREIAGRVVDARTGAAIGAAGLVLSMRSDEGYHMTTRTKAEADGTFRLLGPAYGQHVLKAAAPGYPPVEVTYSFREPEQSRSITIEMEAASEVTLTVQDGRGGPIAGARVLDFRGLDRIGMSVTAPSGTTRIAVPDGETRDVFVIPRDGSLGFLQVRGGTKNATVRIADGVSRLVVRMESEARQPIPNLSAVVRYNGRILPLEVLDALARMQGARVWSDADGRIVLDHMPVGLYELWPVGSRAELRALAAGAGPVASVKIAAAPGENVAVMTFEESRKP